MQCLYCGKNIESKRLDAKFDTDACRKAYSRIADKPELSRTIIADKQMSEINKSDKIIADKPEQPIPEQKADDLSKLTAEELYAQIDSFKGGNEWIDSPYYIELLHRIRKLSVKQLQEQGFQVPAWKRNGKKEPKKTY